MQGESTNNGGDPSYSQDQRQQMAGGSKKRLKHPETSTRAPRDDQENAPSTDDDQLDSSYFANATGQGIEHYGMMYDGDKEHFKHQHINLKQIHQQNSKSQERPQNAGLSNAVQLKGKISKDGKVQMPSAGVKAGQQNNSSGHQGGYYQQQQRVAGGGPTSHSRQVGYDEQTYAMTRSQDPPMNRGGKNNQHRGQKNQGTIKQLVLEDPMANSKMAMQPIPNTMKKAYQVENER